MKKLLLATAISALSISAAQAAPTVYGKLHVTVDSVNKFKTTSTGEIDFDSKDGLWEVNSNASRLGVKGDEKLTDNLSAIYLAEWAVSTDGAGSDVDWSTRNRYVGLKYDRIGAVKVGRLDSYVKTSQAKVDIFNDMKYLDMTAILAGENRLNNVIALESDPKALAGLGFNIMLQQGEGGSLSSNSEKKSESVGDAISASIVYDNKDLGLYAALAGDKNVTNTFFGTGGLISNAGLLTSVKNAFSTTTITIAPGTDFKAEADVIRLVGSLDFGALANVPGLVAGAMFQTAKPTNLAPVSAKSTGTSLLLTALDKEQSFLLSAGYSIPETPFTVKAEYAQSNTKFKNDLNLEEMKLRQYGGLVEYAFNSKTRAYGYVAQQYAEFEGEKSEKLNHAGIGLEFNF